MAEATYSSSPVCASTFRLTGVLTETALKTKKTSAPAVVCSALKINHTSLHKRRNNSNFSTLLIKTCVICREVGSVLSYDRGAGRGDVSLPV